MSALADWIYNWVEEHKGENADGSWFIAGLEHLGEKSFPTEEALDTFLWDYATENPDCYLPSIP